MLLFSRLQIIKNGTLAIPEHVRAALGMHSGLKVHLSTMEQVGGNITNEILICPIPVAERDDLWQLKATFRDRPGIICELLDILRAQNIDVVALRTHTTEQNRYLNIDTHMNARLYRPTVHSQRDPASAAGLPELRAHIIAHFIEDLALDDLATRRPILSVKRNLPLYRSVQLLDDREEAELTNGGVRISDGLVARIRDSFISVYPNIGNLEGHRALPLAAVVGDTEGSVVRALTLFRNTGHVHVRVRAKNRVGCLAEITEALRNRQFNILQMYTRNLASGTENLTDFLLHLPAEIDNERSDAHLRKYVEGIFKLARLRELNCSTSFPEPLNSRKERRQ